jgi:heat shock protein HtpX
MWEAIQSNKRRSWILIGLMGVLLVALGFGVGYAWAPGMGGAVGAVAALGVWLILLLIAFAQGDSILLASAKAAKISKDDAPQLWNVVEEMTIASGLPRPPAIYVIDNEAPNAFAVGRKPESAAVAVTSGLLRRLNRDELQGVVAHEVSHIRNLDVRFMTLASVMVGAIVLIADVFLRSLWFGGGRRSSSSKGGGQAQLVIFALALLLAILAPIAAQLLYFACSRRREYLADASAARYTRYPEGLASALEKIAAKARGETKVNRCLAPLYIVNPRQQGALAALSSTHPPVKTRVAILRSMGGGAGYQAYEAAYKQVVGKSSHCLGSSTLEADEAVAARPASREREGPKAAVERAREAVDLIDRLGGFLLMPCACGVRIKIPPDFKRNSLSCPRCGVKHQVPEAEAGGRSADQRKQQSEPMRYQRKHAGWESFKCTCGRGIQLSPSFSAPRLECPECKRSITIEPPADA